MMLQYKGQMYSVTNKIFDPKTNRDGMQVARMRYEFDIPQLKSLQFCWLGLLRKRSTVTECRGKNYVEY